MLGTWGKYPVISIPLLIASVTILPLVWIIGTIVWNRKKAATLALEKQSSTESQSGAEGSSQTSESRLRKCRACGKDIAKTAAKCPSCGELNIHPAQAFAGLLIVGGGAWFLFFGGLENKVASDMVERYELAQKSGDPIAICVHAGLVAAGYNQAKDEKNYLKWKEIERADCATAKIPRR